MAGDKMNISDLEKTYDIIVIGGGVTGAGVFHEAVRKGYRVLLIEAKDFAWGTSSRSSKMVHGGLRYLKQGKFLLTKKAVKERERLLKRYPGLVTPLNFIMPVFDNYGPSRASMRIGLSIYSLLAGEKQHTSYSKTDVINTI
ncbi:MAG: FAD-dependent oxidoreductase, partial [Desulfobacteraceae bacterium]|nr:FAD-dependent oxidoreductase [Desulfobacteraceae bacterium]